MGIFDNARNNAGNFFSGLGTIANNIGNNINEYDKPLGGNLTDFYNAMNFDPSTVGTTKLNFTPKEGPYVPGQPNTYGGLKTSNPQDSIVTDQTKQEQDTFNAEMAKLKAQEARDSQMYSGGGGVSTNFTPPNTGSVSDYMKAFSEAMAPYMNYLSQANDNLVKDVGTYDPNNQANDTGQFATTAKSFDTQGQNIQNEMNVLNNATNSQKTANTQTEQGAEKQIQDLANEQLNKNNMDARDARLAIASQANGFGGPQAFVTGAEDASSQPYNMANANINTNTQDTIKSLADNLNQTNTGLTSQNSLQQASLMGQLNNLPVEKQKALNDLQTSLDQTKVGIASGQVSAMQGLLQMSTQIDQFNKTYGLNYMKMVNDANIASAQIATTQRGQNLTAANNFNNNIISLYKDTLPTVKGTVNVPNQGTYTYDQYGNPTNQISSENPSWLTGLGQAIGILPSYNQPVLKPVNTALPYLIDPRTGQYINISQ